MNIQTITAPEHWASYLINGDASGLDDGEQAIIDRWIKRENVRAVHGVSEQSRFTWSYRLYSPESDAEGGSVADYECDLYRA